MEKYLNGKEILQRWDIKKIEFFDLVKEGLQPYSPDTTKPVRCKYTTQNRLKAINSQLKIVKKYLKSPNNMTEREQDWILSENKSTQNILKDLEGEKERIVNELSIADKSEDDIEGSWKDFYSNVSERTIKVAINQVLMSEFLKSDIVSVLGPEKKIRADESKYYQKEKSQTKESISDSEIANLIKKAIPEVEIVWAEIKKISDKKNGADKLMKKAVLYKFDKNSNEFKIIKRRYLEINKIYAIFGSNKKRDFVGILLQKIMEGEGLIPMGIQRTYNIYKKIRRSDNTIDTST